MSIRDSPQSTAIRYPTLSMAAHGTESPLGNGYEDCQILRWASSMTALQRFVKGGISEKNLATPLKGLTEDMVPGAQLRMMRSGKTDKSFTYHQHKWQIHPCNGSKQELGCQIWGNNSGRGYEHNQQFYFVVKPLRGITLILWYSWKEKKHAQPSSWTLTHLWLIVKHFAMLSLVSRLKTFRSQLEEDNMQSEVSQKPPSGSKLRILQSVIRWRGRS